MPPKNYPRLSIDLPPSFSLSRSVGDMPKTPTDQLGDGHDLEYPPPPPRQNAFRVRRKRPTLPSQEPEIVGDSIIPSIEMSEAVTGEMSPTVQQAPMQGLLSPLPQLYRMGSEPKTPAPQTGSLHPSFSSPTNEWGLINDSRDRRTLQRSGSVCSTFSDSSISSCDSSAFSAPNGSCASPISETTDPFVENDMTKPDALLSPNLTSPPPNAKRVKTHRKTTVWTSNMDNHLWTTYMNYMADPCNTPFKSLPGVIPPLGVVYRVAGRAKRTWNQQRQITPNAMDVSAREGSPDTIRPNVDKDGRQSKWPRRDAEVRNRLRVLVQRRPNLPPHYQRILRSPSPFTFGNPSSSTDASSSSIFSQRDLNVSLTTATAPSMQPEGPLAQLAQNQHISAPRPQSQGEIRPSNWNARIGRSQAHQKSVSLQTGLQLVPPSNRPDISLASPFDTNRHHLLQSLSATKSLGRGDAPQKTTTQTGPSLESPVELSRAPTFPRSLKRRFKSDEEKPRRPPLPDVFGAMSDATVIARNRGFSVGAVRASTNLAKLFAPPEPVLSENPSQDHEMTEAPAMTEAMPTLPAPTFGLAPSTPLAPNASDDVFAAGSRSAPRRLIDPVPRLGSPFLGTSLRAQSNHNTFPRTYHATPSQPRPFEAHLRGMAAERAAAESRDKEPAHLSQEIDESEL